MAKKIHTNTQRQSERARNADGNRNSGGGQWQWQVDGGNVNDKKNRVHENYWILIQPKIAATK